MFFSPLADRILRTVYLVLLLVTLRSVLQINLLVTIWFPIFFAPGRAGLGGTG